MRDRLIELLKQIYFDQCEECCACTEDGYRCPPTLEEFFADYLLANGVIVPPCKVGQTVYRIYWNFNIDECKVSALTQKADKSWKIRITSGIHRGVFEITPDELGKTVFLTKEEAEKTLAERRKKCDKQNS